MTADQDHSTDDLRDASRGIRLQKALARAGVGSRRRCESLIEAGAVEVNGRVIAGLPAWVDPARDRIAVHGRTLLKPKRSVYILLNKPKRVVSTCDDPDDRRTVLDLVDHPEAPRLFPVGRLDYDTSGLVLLTNDGELANRLTHPRFGVEKTYRATVKGAVDDAALAKLHEGLYLADRREGRTVGARRTEPARLRIVARDRERTVLDITLKEGRNRQVRRLFAKLGHPVKKLVRVQLGPLKLKGVGLGRWRELTRSEVRALREASNPERRVASAALASGPREAESRRAGRPSDRNNPPSHRGATG